MSTEDIALAERLDAELPQTQCTRCGYAACRPYAQAMARGEADINQCAPGGAEGIRRLASLLQRPFKPLDPAYGIEAPPAVAAIDEALCIGCTLCMQACPVDAISGAPKFMHTVISSQCTGCELCLPPCPVDCIAMAPVAVDPLRRAERAGEAKSRYDKRQLRLEREHQRRLKKLAAHAVASPDEARRARVIAGVLARARSRRATTPGQSGNGQ